MNPRFPIGLIRLSIAVLAMLTAGVVSGLAQGIGFQFTASSYTAVQGQDITASVSMQQVSDPYEVPIDEYGDTEYGYITDWALHVADSDLYEEIEVTDQSGDPVDAVELNWATGVTGTETFNISNPNSGVAGPDFVGYLFTDNNDPDYGDDYYWALCYPSDFSGYSAVVSTYAIQAFTNYNPNTIISAVVNGSSQLTNSEPAQSTDLRIYRSDTYNNRTVNYSVSGTAVNGSDYTATFGGSVQFTAGGSNYVDILVSTLNPLTTAKTLTLTITSDSLGTYQGSGSSAAINFEPYVAPDDPADTDDPDDGSAQMFQCRQPEKWRKRDGFKRGGQSAICHHERPGRFPLRHWSWADPGIVHYKTQRRHKFVHAVLYRHRDGHRRSQLYGPANSSDFCGKSDRHQSVGQRIDQQPRDDGPDGGFNPERWHQLLSGIQPAGRGDAPAQQFIDQFGGFNVWALLSRQRQ